MLDILATLKATVDAKVSATGATEPAQVARFVKEAMDDFDWGAFRSQVEADLVASCKPASPAPSPPVVQSE